MNDFTFQNTTKVLFGRGQLAHLGEELDAAGAKRVLMVYGGGSVKRTGTYDLVHGLLDKAGISTFELSGVEPNPRHTTVNRGVEIARGNGVDAVLAVGGGSVIDCAKAVSATVPSGTDDVWDLVEGRIPYPEALPVFVVLTMAGTGSEMTRSAVISNLETREKRSIAGPQIRPAVVFENPELTFTVGAYQTACGSVDIMSHIFDVSYFSADGKMDMIRRVQEEVLRTVVRFAPVAIASPDDYDARANLMWASSWALNSFMTCGIRQNTVCHAIEHELSAHYDITHGLGLAIITPRWMRHVLAKNPEVTAPAFARFGTRVLDVPAAEDDRIAAGRAIDALERLFFETLGLERSLSALGIDDSRFAQMAAHACRERGSLHGITDLAPRDVEEILRACL